MSGVDIAGLVSEWQEAMGGVTPGPWKTTRKFEVGPVSDADDQSRGMVIPFADVFGEDRGWNLLWIARCSPSGISALLDALSEATRQRDEALAALKAQKDASDFAKSVSAATPDGSQVAKHLMDKADLLFAKAERLRDAALPDPGTEQREAGV